MAKHHVLLGAVLVLALAWGAAPPAAGSTGSAGSIGSRAALVGHLSSSLTDPQVLWDRDTSRFYYVVLDASHDRFDVGFSKTASPGSAADWCKYTADFGYGSDLPDYPKLGDTRDFWLMGANDF